MASNWQKISIPFAGGIDTKSDAKTVPVGKLVDLDNGIFTKMGTVKRRWGYKKYKKLDVSNTLLSGARGLATRQDELLMFSRSTLDDTTSALYSFDTKKEKWKHTGSFPLVETTTKRVANTSSGQTVPDMATAAGVTAYVWTDSRGGVYGSVVNDTTGQPYTSEFQLDASGTNPRCIAVGARLFMCYFDGTSSLKALIVNANDVDTTVSHTTLLSGSVNSNGYYDIVKLPSSDHCIVGTIGTSGEVYSTMFDKSGSAVGSTITHTTFASIDGVAVGANDTHHIVAFVRDTTAVYVSTGTNNVETGCAGFATAVGDSYTNPSNHISAHISAEPGTTEGTVVFDEDNSSAPENYVTYATVTLSSGALGSSATGPFGYLASHIFELDNNTKYVVLGTETENRLQNQYFLYSITDWKPVARVLYGAGKNQSSAPSIPSATVSGNTFKLALEEKQVFEVESESKSGYGKNGISEVTFVFDKSPATAEVGNVCYITNGSLFYYDGVSPVESGFWFFPEMDVSLDGSTSGHGHVSEAGSGNLADGTYGYRVYYEWTNAAGERERSGGISFSHAATSGGAKITLTIPNLHHTRKTDASGDGRSNVTIVVYRTAVNGSTYYRVSSPDPSVTGDNDYIVNDETTYSQTWVDNYKDDGTGSVSGLSGLSITQNELDYQGSGEKPNLAPSACSLLAQSSNRLFLAGGDIGDHKVAYSKLYLDGETVGFNNTFTLSVDSLGGKITALATLNGNLIVFKKRHMFLVTGDGPNNFGFGDFNQAREISADIGCTQPESIVSIPGGLLFASEKGIWRLNSNMVPSYVGAPVEAFNGAEYKGVHIPDKNMVVFVAETGTSLVYDYQFNQWGTFSNHLGTSVVVHLGNVVYARTDGSIYAQDNSVYDDAGAGFALRFLTAPLRMNGLQELWRCRRVYLLGNYKSDHQLQVKVYRNRDGFPVETFKWDVSDFINSSTWGSQATWGADSVWGGSNTREYQMSHRLKVQKYQTVQFEIEDTARTSGEGYELNELALEWAPMRNLARLPASRRT